MRREGVRVLLGLGANLGDAHAQLAGAVRRLEEVVHVDAVSSVYRTEPVGFRDQPEFLNLVVAARCTLRPEALLDAAQAIEAGLGRVRTFANAPRTIDIDLLAFGDQVIRTDRLTVPHPRMAERGFVLHPLAEVAPEWRHPVLGATARELLQRAVKLERVHRVGALRPPR